MDGYQFKASSLFKMGAVCVLLVSILLTADAMAAVQSSFTGTFDLLVGSDVAGLDGATLEFVTTTDETWGASPVDPSVSILSATATVTGSVANDGVFSTETASPFWINQFTVTWDADANSTSIDFALPDTDLLQVTVVTGPAAVAISSGNSVVPENWGTVLNATAITGESPTSAGNLYLFTDRTFVVEEYVAPPEPITIDFRDSINLKSRGVLSVTVESSSIFDAREVDVDTLLFGDPNLSGSIGPSRSMLEDVTDDGLIDLVLKFRIPDLMAAGALDLDSYEGLLSGSTLSGSSIAGSDTFGIVPSASLVPEPNTLALALFSIPGLGLIRRLRRTIR